MKFFERYNRVMRLTFAVVLLLSLALFALQARSRYENAVQSMSDQFSELTTNLDNYLKNTTDHLNALQIAAQMSLCGCVDAPSSVGLISMIRDEPGKDYFSLDHVLPPYKTSEVANLTGKGSFQDRSWGFYREVLTALSLNPLFHITTSNLPQVAWVYYVSKQNFISIYPWMPSSKYYFKETTIEREYFQMALPENNPHRRRYWTGAYVDQGGKGLMVTCCAPVYEVDTFRGVVSIDLTLDTLNRFVADFPFPEATVFIANAHDELLAHPQVVHSQKDKVNTIRAGMPSELQGMIPELFSKPKMEVQNVSGWIFFYNNLQFAPWRMVFVAPQKKVFFSGLLEMGFIYFVPLIGLTLMLIIAHRITRTEFIHPAELLVTHISNVSSDPEAPIPSVPASWRPWFLSISRIFRENSILLEELRERNEHLDSLVAARTHELSERNVQLERTMDQLRDMQEQIILKEKMASLGELTAGVAHEIKNPLNFVNNFAELSLDLVKDLRQAAENQKNAIAPPVYDDIQDILDTLDQNVAKIREHGRRADSIVKSMLLHSRGKTGERRITDFNALVAEYVNLAYHGMRAQDQSFNVAINTQYDGGIGSFEIVPQDMGRAVLNIVTNACYAMHEKMNSGAGPAYHPILEITTTCRDNDAVLVIRDNGPGIPAANRDKIFQPFFTTKPTGKGTGLGLSITYDIIVKQHRGQIQLDTCEGEHTRFTISIPRLLQCKVEDPERMG